MALLEVKVPNLGEFKDVEIIEVHVKPGDAVGAEAPLITLETDKAAMEVPAPAGGTVREVLVQVGGRVSEGTLIVRLESAATSVTPSSSSEAPPPIKSMSPLS